MRRHTPRSGAGHEPLATAGCAGFRALLSRRQSMQVGSLGALGLTLADFLRLEARSESNDSQAVASAPLVARAKSVIHLNLPGGVPQHESFDPKPEAPVECRGSFGVVKTNTGEVFSDNFPKTAAIADKLTVVRTVVGKIPDHALATYHLFKGYSPTAVIDYPNMGSIVSHELGVRGELPPYIAIPAQESSGAGTGFLSSTYGAFELNADPGTAGFAVRDFSIPSGVSRERFDRRLSLRSIVQDHIREVESDPATLDTMDDFYRRAHTLLTSEQAQKAFTFEGETEEAFQLYGRDTTGSVIASDLKYHKKGLAERLILARRLVEAGTRFVTVTYGGWDAHADVRKNCLDQMAPLDHAISGLITDLDRRGMLDTTLVWVTSEFGRTPRINASAGRDHWARCYSMLLAGGGITRGVIHGRSDATAAEPASDGVTLEDVLFTVYHQLGIDADKRLLAFGTRPIDVIKDGHLIRKILA